MIYEKTIFFSYKWNIGKSSLSLLCLKIVTLWKVKEYHGKIISNFMIDRVFSWILILTFQTFSNEVKMVHKYASKETFFRDKNFIWYDICYSSVLKNKDIESALWKETFSCWLNSYMPKRTEGLFIAGFFITAPKLRSIESRKMIQIKARGPDIRFREKNISKLC